MTFLVFREVNIRDTITNTRLDVSRKFYITNPATSLGIPYSNRTYCNMTPESRNNEIRIDAHS
jgi:hypothetical protein